MRPLVISCSLNPESRSAALARRAHWWLQEQGREAGWIDLRESVLPLCDGGDAFACRTTSELKRRVAEADAVLLATPVYNYDANAASKNLIELTGRAWEGKVVGFLCAAGGRSSYMSIMPLANSLMLDFRCLIVPRFVFATDADFEGDEPGETIDQRIARLCSETVNIAEAIAQVSA